MNGTLLPYGAAEGGAAEGASMPPSSVVVANDSDVRVGGGGRRRPRVVLAALLAVAVVVVVVASVASISPPTASSSSSSDNPAATAKQVSPSGQGRKAAVAVAGAEESSASSVTQKDESGIPSPPYPPLSSSSSASESAVAGVSASDPASASAPVSAVDPPSHPSFKLLSETYVSEYDLTIATYRHGKTDAEVLAVLPHADFGNDSNGNEDDKEEGAVLGPDLAFGISFRTVPTDSTGVAHILEHSVLCGSEKYPVKSPFLHLNKGSLHTFLNAMTSADWTTYPVSSRSRKDLANLAGVYLDAVFRPRCVKEEWVLKQEGWRYELTDVDDDLDLKGVVMSEMMGVFSDPNRIRSQVSQSLLFPDTTYKFVSGGDPDVISDLMFDKFKAFHEHHYHPTNSKTYVNGDAETVKMILDMTDEYFAQYDLDPEVRSRSAVPYQSLRYQEPVRERRPYAGTEGEGGSGHSSLSVHWLLNDKPLGALTEMALVVLDELLLGSSTSALRKALLDSGLGTDVLAGGTEDDLLQHSFGVGLRGIESEEDAGKVEGVIMDALEMLARDGFEKEDLDAAVNLLEFELRETKSGHYPPIIKLFLRILRKWNYDQDPVSALVFEKTLNELKAEIESNGSDLFQKLIQTYLLDNTHRVVLEMYPRETYGPDKLAEKKAKLAAVKGSMSSEELQGIVDTTKALKERQSKDDPPEAAATIPTLSLDDLPSQDAEYPISVEEDAFGSEGVTLITHDVPSSRGIVYVDFGLDLSAVPLEDVPLLPLLAGMMIKTGTSEMSEQELDRRIGVHTGGIGASTLIATVKDPASADSGTVVSTNANLRTMLFVKGKCTSDKSSHLFSLMHEILTDANLDSPQRAITLLQGMASNSERYISTKGNEAVRGRIEARYSVAGYLRELIEGVSQAESINGFLKTAQEDWPSLRDRLLSMRKAILKGGKKGGGGGGTAVAILNLTGERKVLDAIEADAKDFLATKVPLMRGIGGEESDAAAAVADAPQEVHKHPWIAEAEAAMASSVPIRDEAVSVASTSVNYVGQGGVLYQPGERVPGSASVAPDYLRNGYLWENVRVKNGAYGIKTGFDPRAGTFVMASYRDPNLGATLDVYDGAAESLLADASPGGILLAGEDGSGGPSGPLLKAVIAAIGSLDGRAPTPLEIGWTSLMRWMVGESPEERRRWREEILNTAPSDFADFAERLKEWTSPSIAVVGSESAFEEYSSSRPDSAPLEIVLTI